MPFSPALAGWWWLYWRLYDTRIPLDQLGDTLGRDRPGCVLASSRRTGRASRERNGTVTLTDAGAFWLHLAQNYFALDYVNTVWTAARRQPWPSAVSL